MAEFNINCPHCGTELVADEAWVGMELECPQCKRKFAVPPKPAPVVPKLRLSPRNPAGMPQNGQGVPPMSPTGGGFAAGNLPPWSYVPNTPKEPASPDSFSYQRIGNKFYAVGDYPTLFALIHDFCLHSGLQVEKSDINQGCITIKYNFEFTHFVFFYQEADKIVIEAASNALCKFRSAIDKQLSKLVEAIEVGFYQYKSGQYMPGNCCNASLPQVFQKAEIDYTSEAKALTWIGPLLTILLPFGIIVAFVFGIIYLVNIYSTKARKGQEFVYISFGADIIGLFVNLVLYSTFFG